MCGGDSGGGGSRREITLPREASYSIVAVGKGGRWGKPAAFSYLLSCRWGRRASGCESLALGGNSSCEARGCALSL